MPFGTLIGFAAAFHASDSLAGRFGLGPYGVAPNHSLRAKGPKNLRRKAIAMDRRTDRLARHL